MTNPLLIPQPMSPEQIADLVERTRRNMQIADDSRESARLEAISGSGRQVWRHGPPPDPACAGRRAAALVRIAGVSVSYAARRFGVTAQRVSNILREETKR